MKSTFLKFSRALVAKNGLRPKMVPLTMLAIKRGFLCNFSKTLKGHHFMGHSGKGLKFSVTIDL